MKIYGYISLFWVSWVDLSRGTFHILHCTTMVVRFLPKLGREYAHGLFFGCFPYNLRIENTLVPNATEWTTANFHGAAHNSHTHSPQPI